MTRDGVLRLMCCVVALGLSASGCGETESDRGADGEPTRSSIESRGGFAAGRTEALVVTDVSGRLAWIRPGEILSLDAALGEEQVLVDGVESRAGEWHVLHTDCLEDGGTPCSVVYLSVIDDDGRLVSQTEVADAGRHASLMVSDQDPVVVLNSDRDVVVLQLGPKEELRELWRSPPFDMASIRAEANETGDLDVRPPRLRICADGDRVAGVYRAPASDTLEVLRLAGADDLRSDVPAAFEASAFEVVCGPEEPFLIGVLEDEVSSFGLVSGDGDAVSVESPSATGPVQRDVDDYQRSFLESRIEVDLGEGSTASPDDASPLTLIRHHLDGSKPEEVVYDGLSKGAPVVTADGGLIAWSTMDEVVLQQR